MKYCLYIDESGDFESAKGEWVISGFLCAGSHNEADKHLKKICESLCDNLSAGSIRDFHLTDFRKIFGHETAVDMASQLLGALEKLPCNYHFLTTINHSKVKINDREKTYRLMLCDLVAMFETTLPEDEILEGLDLVVATRTINDVRQSNASDIQECVFKLIPQSLEVDLATKGLVDLIGKKISIKLDYANNLWGLVIADFIANINYNKNRTPESNLLTVLEKKGLFSSFDSFSSHGERRAAVAERDRDYTLASVRWLILLEKSSSTVARLGLLRTLKSLSTELGESGSKIAFEALLDRIYRICKPKPGHDYFIKLVSMLKEVMQDLQSKYNLNLENYFYRTNVLLIKVVNHTGNTAIAMSLLNEQSKLINSVVFDPDNLPMILESSLAESEIFYNSFNHGEALKRAKKCLDLTENYISVVSLV